MISWIKKTLKPYSLAPNNHVLEQVILLLENKMPYNVIQQTLSLKTQSLDEFTQHVYHKQLATYHQLKNKFSQIQLLNLYKNIHAFQQHVKMTLFKKCFYPIAMVIVSYAVFLVFYVVIYPMFLALSPNFKTPVYLVYTFVSFVLLCVIFLMIIFVFMMMRSSYQWTLFLRTVHKKYPHWIVFEYYTILLLLVYRLCLNNRFSSLLTIELFRGFHDTPFLKAIAYDIQQSCQNGTPLHQAIKDQQLSLLLNQTIDLGIAANDLKTYISNCSLSYQSILTSKLNAFAYKVNLISYSFVLIHCALIVSILQIPTKMIAQSF